MKKALDVNHVGYIMSIAHVYECVRSVGYEHIYMYSLTGIAAADWRSNGFVFQPVYRRDVRSKTEMCVYVNNFFERLFSDSVSEKFDFSISSLQQIPTTFCVNLMYNYRSLTDTKRFVVWENGLRKLSIKYYEINNICNIYSTVMYVNTVSFLNYHNLEIPFM